MMSEVCNLDEEGIDRPTASSSLDASDAALLGRGSGSRTVPGKGGQPGGICGAYAWVRSVFFKSSLGLVIVRGKIWSVLYTGRRVLVFSCSSFIWVCLRPSGFI